MYVLYSVQVFSKAGAFHSNRWGLKAFLPQLGRNCATRMSASASLSCQWFFRHTCTPVVVLLSLNVVSVSPFSHLPGLVRDAFLRVLFLSQPLLSSSSLLNCSQSSGEEKKKGGDARWRLLLLLILPVAADTCDWMMLVQLSAWTMWLQCSFLHRLFVFYLSSFAHTSTPLVTVDMLLSDWSGKQTIRVVRRIIYRLMVFDSY